jgi:hypothetical protein
MIRKTRSSATGGQSDTTVLCRPLLATHLSSLADALFGDCETQRGTFERRRLVLSPPRSTCAWPCIFCQSIEKSSCLARKTREVTDRRLRFVENLTQISLQLERQNGKNTDRELFGIGSQLVVKVTASYRFALFHIGR